MQDLSVPFNWLISGLFFFKIFKDVLEDFKTKKDKRF